MAKLSPMMVVPPVVFGGMFLLFFLGNTREDADMLPTALAGKPAPAVALAPLGDAVPFTDADLRDGEVKLVNYWASWCGPCRVEHPNLEALAAEGIPVYGINYKDKSAQALAFLDELGNPYARLGADPAGRNALQWGVYGVPETYVIDGDGTVILRWAGPVTQRVIDNTIRPALEQAGR